MDLQGYLLLLDSGCETVWKSYSFKSPVPRECCNLMRWKTARQLYFPFLNKFHVMHLSIAEARTSVPIECTLQQPEWLMIGIKGCGEIAALSACLSQLPFWGHLLKQSCLQKYHLQLLGNLFISIASTNISTDLAHCWRQGSGLYSGLILLTDLKKFNSAFGKENRSLHASNKTLWVIPKLLLELTNKVFSWRNNIELCESSF